MEEKRLGGPGHRVSVAQISESTVYRKHRLGGYQSAKEPRQGWWELRLEGHLGLDDGETKTQIP